MNRLFRGIAISWFIFWTYLMSRACVDSYDASDLEKPGAISAYIIWAAIWMVVVVVPSAICWAAGRKRRWISTQESSESSSLSS